MPTEVRTLIFEHYFGTRYVTEDLEDRQDDLAPLWIKDYDCRLLACSKQIHAEGVVAESRCPVVLDIRRVDSIPPDNIRKAAVKVFGYRYGGNSDVEEDWHTFDCQSYPAITKLRIYTPDINFTDLGDLGGNVDDFFHGRLDSRIVQYGQQEMGCPHGGVRFVDGSATRQGFSIVVTFMLFCDDDADQYVVSSRSLRFPFILTETQQVKLMIKDGKWMVKKRYCQDDQESRFSVSIGKDGVFHFEC